MKMRKLTIALLVVAAVVACTKSEDVANGNIPVDYGVIKMSVNPNMGLTSRVGSSSNDDDLWYLTKVAGVEYDRDAQFVDEEGKLPMPSWDKLKLHIEPLNNSEDYNQYYWPFAPGVNGYGNSNPKFHADSTVNIYNDLWEQRYILMGDYKFELEWGDADYEGPVIATDATQQAKPYFYGIANNVTIVPRTKAEVPMEVKLANSIVRLEFSRTFKKYFENGGEFYITTWTDPEGNNDGITTTTEGESGTDSTGQGGSTNVTEPVAEPDAKFVIPFSKELDDDDVAAPEGKYKEGTPFFIKNGVGRRFEISGWAVKQKPASSIDPDTVRFRNLVNFAEQTIDGKEIQGINVPPTDASYYPKMYTYKLDVEADYVKLSVVLSDRPTDEDKYISIPDYEDDNDGDVELNDGSKPDQSGGEQSGNGESGEQSGGSEQP